MVSGLAEAATVLVIVGVICLTYLEGYLLRWLLTALTGNQLVFGLPPAVRALGGAVVIFGVVVATSAARVRKPKEILDSTSVTLLKIIGRLPLQNRGARTEPFVPGGPYRWVRNPMYSGVLLALLGLGILYESAVILLWWVAATGYFAFFLVPREEKELDVLFGEGYREYKRQVPMMFPTGRRFRTQASQ
jgi:protein-S-isoprenylcysteine O-methyltransferase Ste14